MQCSAVQCSAGGNQAAAGGWCRRAVVATCFAWHALGNGGRGDEVTADVNGIWLQLKTARMLLVYVILFYDLCACTDRYAVVLRMQNEQVM